MWTDLAQLEAHPSSKHCRGVVEEEIAAAGADQDAAVLQQAEAVLEAIRSRAPEAAAAIGVDLQDIEGAALAIRRVTATGTGVSVEGAKMSSDITAVAFDRVTAGRDIRVHGTSIAGISKAQYRRLAEELGVTHAALKSFFTILERAQVPPEDLDRTFRQIAASYKELQAKLQRVASDDPAIVALKSDAREALEAGEYARAEVLLNDASAKDLEVAQELQETAATRLCSAAASRAANGDLNMTQLAYAKAAAYYRQAVEVLESVPTARQELAEYLSAWGLASYRAGEYPAVTMPWQRALAIREEVLGAKHPDVATSLNHLALLYDDQGRYAEAEPLYQRALAIHEEVLGPAHPQVATVRENYAALREAMQSDAQPSMTLLQRIRAWWSANRDTR
jgi:tetratricopeptide (TPR) repeat protein